MTEHRITIKSVSGYKVLDHFFDYELDGGATATNGDIIIATGTLDKKLYIFAMAVNATLDNSIDLIGTVCLRIDNYLDNPMNWKTEYWDFQFSGGVIHAALYGESGFLYFLGFHGKETSNHMILGRMNTNELSEKTNASRIEFFQNNKTWDNILRKIMNYP